MVVTYNRKELLRECLQALQAQERKVDGILVVDNASTDGTRELLAQEFPEIEVLVLKNNLGGAGGFHNGMWQAFEKFYDWIWLMDDDGKPAPDCLLRLMEHNEIPSGSKCAPMVLLPVQQDRSGRPYGIGIWNKFYVDVTKAVTTGERPANGNYMFAFVGPLISREVVALIGLPRQDFFIWFDDYEYALRIHRHFDQLITVVPDAVFHHDVGAKTREIRMLGRKALRNESPAWKTYYGTRNHLFTVLRTRRNPREVFWFLVRESWLLTGDMLHETDRWSRAFLRARGLRDGVLGRMGKRI